MSDLVERLRATSTRSRVTPLQPHKTLWDEAADELEHLRAENATLREALKNHAEEAAKMLSPCIPDGWVMVPKEPTNEMLDAPENAWPADAKITWESMIASAPKPE